MTWHRAIAGKTVGACLVACTIAHGASAQANADSVKLRNDCRLAEQVLRTGEPAQQREFATSVIGLCGSEAVPALLSAWAAPDSATLPLLVTSTRGIVSPDIADALMQRLGNASQSTHTRVAALLVLLTYADPFVVPDFARFEGDSTRVLTNRYGDDPHDVPQVGRQTLPSGFISRVRSALSQIASGDPDSAMRVAARVALRNPPIQ